MADKDYSLDNMEREVVIANGGRPLTEKQKAEVLEMYLQIAAAKKALDDYVESQVGQAPLERSYVEQLSREADAARARLNARCAERPAEMGWIKRMIEKIATKHEFAALAVSISIWLIVLLAFVFVVPVFAAMYADFGARLPFPTQWCFDFSSFTRDHFYLVTLILAGVLVVTAAWIREKKNKAALILSLASGAIAVLFLVVALFLPVFNWAQWHSGS